MSAFSLESLLPQLITIPGSSFWMGTPDADRSALAKRYGGTRESYAEESPQHEVFVQTFAIAQTPVTNALYAMFQAATNAHRPMTWRTTLPSHVHDHPVVDISWHDAQMFCQWLSFQTGRMYRLPTEAEWEKAARGTDRRGFAWGNEFTPDRCNTKESGIGATTPVGQYVNGASPYGVLDMTGNVWEWTQSLQAPYPYTPDDGRNNLAPRRQAQKQRFWQRLFRAEAAHETPAIETRRIIRGGCYANPEGFARCACRLRLAPDRRTPFLGLRLASDH